MTGYSGIGKRRGELLQMSRTATETLHSAGFTYAHQVLGLLGYDIPKSQLVFGTVRVPRATSC